MGYGTIIIVVCFLAAAILGIAAVLYTFWESKNEPRKCDHCGRDVAEGHED